MLRCRRSPRKRVGSRPLRLDRLRLWWLREGHLRGLRRLKWLVGGIILRVCCG